jgi:L-ascorbate metabolism protein UlaG (beta-lactamase superfamily)
VELIYLGHAGFCIRTAGHEVLIDPFLSGNPLAKHTPEDFSPSFVVLTHAHGDHVGDTEAIAKRSGAKVVSSVEIVNHLSKRGLEGLGMNLGGSHAFPFGMVKFTPAWHSSSFPDGTYGGMPMGVVLTLEGKRLYHAGDTALFGDMALIGRQGLELAMLPIGDHFTMGPEDALEAVKLLRPKRVIPIHYTTFEPIRQDASAFKTAVEREPDSVCEVLEPGATLEL